ncbi:Leucine-rich repeat-containing protein [Corchorus olitorius]|uniref:Leucine-rich repeat-containing protein n=1 Tax=Corchorus olitorius TaxID=93759 RepID=A0A1R3IU46_9ROSI|nr:Leucine-rich repeat-containing protein [Corchorus olitorius]
MDFHRKSLYGVTATPPTNLTTVQPENFRTWPPSHFEVEFGLGLPQRCLKFLRIQRLSKFRDDV